MAEAMVKYQAKDGQDIELSPDVVRKYLVQGNPEAVTTQELVYFMGVCKARGLNPFKKDCYLIKYGKNDSAAIVVSIDYLRAHASAHKDCMGWHKGPILMRDEAIVHSSGLVIEGDVVLGGWCTVHRKGWQQPFVWEVPLAPYIKKKQDGGVTKFWQVQNQSFMIAKVAEAQALRTVFADDADTQHVYIDDEVLEASDATPDDDAPPVPTGKKTAGKAKPESKQSKSKKKEEPPQDEGAKGEDPFAAAKEAAGAGAEQQEEKQEGDEVDADFDKVDEAAANNPHPEEFDISAFTNNVELCDAFQKQMKAKRDQQVTLEILDAIISRLNEEGGDVNEQLASQLIEWVSQ